MPTEGSPLTDQPGGLDPHRWDTTHMQDMTGKTAIVTGANSGLGFEIALALAHKGATVILACRDADKAAAAMQGIRASAPAAKLEFHPLDLADLASVHMFANRFLAGHGRLDVLCNNAGVMALPQRKTQDGFEMQIGTNHLGHFALTALLMPVIEQTPLARVVTTTSGFHWMGRIRIEDVNGAQAYSRWGAYCQSKLANLMFAFELQRRLQAAGLSAASLAAHPGYASTNLQFAAAAMESTAFARLRGRWLMAVSNGLLAQSARMGALPILYAATAAAEGGKLIAPRFGLRGHPAEGRAAPRSRDQHTSNQLWTLSEQLVGLRCLESLA